MGNNTSTAELPVLNASGGLKLIGELKTDKQKRKAIELIRQTQTRIANLTVIADNGNAERKAILKKFRSTTVGMKLTEVEEKTRKSKIEIRELASQYAGMLAAFKELGLEIDAKQIKQIKEYQK